MRIIASFLALGLIAGLSAPAEAQALACGGEYTVKRGDTLQRLTNAAYGPGKSWQLLYRPNRSVVGANPSLIEVGMVLTIPCREGQATAPDTAAAAPATTAAATETAVIAAPVVSASLPGGIRMITGTDWAPFSNQDQEQGGMITEIVDVALKSATDDDGFKIDFINDWSAHMQPLIQDGAYDFTFPWFRPNCSVIEKLGPGSQFRCNNLAWSDPLFEQIISYYMRASDANKPSDHTGLFGRTLCRPKGYALFMLEEKDLVEPNITLVTPLSPADCFEQLVAGEVDAVILASMVADDAIARNEMANEIEEQPELATIATLHAVTSINNPDKDRQIAAINAGIKELRESGKWFEIVQRHLIAHARLTASN